MKRLTYNSAVLVMAFFLLSSFTDKSAKLLPTSLRVTVLDNLGNTVEGASVTLYANEEDYFEEREPVRTAIKTDAKGRAFFKKLKATKYFIHAEKGKKDNVGESVSTNKLKEGRINLVNVIIR